MSKDKQLGDYEVGYCKPPVATRFKPGQSGNPSGRRRKKEPATLSEAFKAALLKPQWVAINGKRVRMTRMDVIAERVVSDAMQGDRAARQDVLRQMQLIDKFEREHARKSVADTPVQVTLKLGDDRIEERIREREIEQILEERRRLEENLKHGV